MSTLPTKLNKSLKVIQDKGFSTFLQAVINVSKLNYIFYRSKLAGGYKITIDEKSLDLSFSSVNEVRSVRYIEIEEDAIIRDCLRELEAEDVVWDVGAHIGVHSCFFGERAKKVISIEPYTPNIRRLQENLEKNDVNADIIPVALSGKDGTELLSVGGMDSPGDQWPALLPDSISENRRKRLRNSDTVEIDVKKGDSLVDDGVTPPTVVKIDVEGSSHKVLQGMRDTLKRENCRLVYVEVHLPNSGERRPSVEDFRQNPEAIRETLEEYGFDTCIPIEREADFFVKGVK